MNQLRCPSIAQPTAMLTVLLKAHTHTHLKVAQQMKRQGHDGTGATEKRPWVKQTTAAKTESERKKESERWRE